MEHLGRGRFRWRTRLRRRLPWFLIDRGVAGKGATDCGRHEWYRSDDTTDCCYHCAVGQRPYDPARWAERRTSTG